MEEAESENMNTTDLKGKRSSHKCRVRKERREFYNKRDRGGLFLANFCSIIDDGADQSAFGLPHFVEKARQQSASDLKVRLIGILQHKRANMQHLCTITEEH